MNFPVSFAGIVINPGDIIVGDSDGLLAIRPDEHTAELAEIARKTIMLARKNSLRES